MRLAKVSAYFGPLSLSIISVFSLLASNALRAQAPPIPSVSVRMIEGIDSSRDPAAKQYRASVTRTVDAGNGVTIPQGSAAVVTLANSGNGSGWTTKLLSVTINGQPVAVASGPASVTAPAQSAAASAVSSVNSVLGGFGRRVNAPAAATAIATGQRAIVPFGTVLSFVLTQPPAAPAGIAPQPMTASAAPAPAAAYSPAPANASIAAQSISPGALAATIQETLLGPGKQAGMFVVSPDGGHYAAPAMHGTREVIVIDGVDGPEFDHAAHTWNGEALDFVFSADGKHSCYVAQSGDDMFLVRDGKTAFKILTLKTLPGNAKQGTMVKVTQRYVHNPDHQVDGNAVGHRCLLSPSGEHVAVVSNEANASESGSAYMFLDGVKSPVYNVIDPNQVAFAAEKLVYAAQTADHTWRLVVNDKSGPVYGGVKNLLVNDDNSHYAFIGAAVGGAWGVGVDGVPGVPRGEIGNLYIASNGRVAYSTIARMAGATLIGSSGLYVDDQNLGPVQMPFAVVDSIGRGSALQPYVLFSPDGKRFAYTKQASGGFTVVVDGKAGQTYNGIGVFQFSPDSKHYAYVGTRTEAFAVYDGQEMPGEDSNGVSNFVFSQTGGHFAYLAKSARAGIRMVVDGKASPPFYGLVPNSMSFSEDGKHYAYATQANGSNWQFIRDGVATKVTSLISFTTRTGPPHIDFPPLIFSGDGTRLVWGWPKPDGVSKDVISIDGQEVMHGYSTYEFPEFSPDSRHFATMIWDANKYTVAVDGKTGPHYDEFLEVNRNAARFLDSQTFRFLGVKNGSVYRVTVKLGG
jgi:hypothetical protein